MTRDHKQYKTHKMTPTTKERKSSGVELHNIRPSATADAEALFSQPACSKIRLPFCISIIIGSLERPAMMKAFVLVRV